MQPTSYFSKLVQYSIAKCCTFLLISFQSKQSVVCTYHSTPVPIHPSIATRRKEVEITGESMDSARRHRVTVIATMPTNQRVARNLQVQLVSKKSITTLTYPDSVCGCYWLQNSPKARNTEDSRLRLLVQNN